MWSEICTQFVRNVDLGVAQTLNALTGHDYHQWMDEGDGIMVCVQEGFHCYANEIPGQLYEAPNMKV